MQLYKNKKKSVIQDLYFFQQISKLSLQHCTFTSIVTFSYICKHTVISGFQESSLQDVTLHKTTKLSYCHVQFLLTFSALKWIFLQYCFLTAQQWYNPILGLFFRILLFTLTVSLFLVHFYLSSLYNVNDLVIQEQIAYFGQ